MRFVQLSKTFILSVSALCLASSCAYASKRARDSSELMDDSSASHSKKHEKMEVDERDASLSSSFSQPPPSSSFRLPYGLHIDARHAQHPSMAVPLFGQSCLFSQRTPSSYVPAPIFSFTPATSQSKEPEFKRRRLETENGLDKGTTSTPFRKDAQQEDSAMNIALLSQDGFCPSDTHWNGERTQQTKETSDAFSMAFLPSPLETDSLSDQDQTRSFSPERLFFHPEKSSEEIRKLPELPHKYLQDDFNKELMTLYPSVVSVSRSNERLVRWALYLHDRKHYFKLDHKAIANTLLQYDITRKCNYHTICVILTDNGRRSRKGGGTTNSKTEETIKEIYRKDFFEKGIKFPSLQNLVDTIRSHLPNIRTGSILYSLPQIADHYRTPVPEAILQERLSGENTFGSRQKRDKDIRK